MFKDYLSTGVIEVQQLHEYPSKMFNERFPNSHKYALFHLDFKKRGGTNIYKILDGINIIKTGALCNYAFEYVLDFPESVQYFETHCVKSIRCNDIVIRNPNCIFQKNAFANIMLLCDNLYLPYDKLNREDPRGNYQDLKEFIGLSSQTTIRVLEHQIEDIRVPKR